MTTPCDGLADIISAILRNGAELLGLTYGQLAVGLFGVLLPLACIMCLCSASLALTRHKTSRFIAIVCLVLGCLSLLIFLSVLAYIVIFGTSWAHAVK